jgi:thiamine pyrophosphokinase
MPAEESMGEQAEGPDESTSPIAVVVVTGGSALDPVAVAAIPDEAFVVAADGGLDHARAAGIRPDVLVGDLDSVSPDGLAWATANVAVEQHPADKVATDTELAITYAAAMRPQRVVLIAGIGDRLDHAIAALGALGSLRLATVGRVEAWWGGDELMISRPGRPVTIERPTGTTFSVLAMHGACHGVTITGARWPLTGAHLGPLVGEGVSNEVVTSPTRIDVGDGVLTVIIPGAQP